ncbi:aspartate aminotransferase family protein [Nocardiopsis halotolerans]|uniref:aspartate aminotransferase family protein n=1 Tax=Nocardiopsis halotolerans TaxID=124252 RepID=UPI0003463BC2|nr:aminotransferase class III-fold pyridoxal phosphate-dependent enzyme [Nocardiopsis halotolerans]
MQEASQEESPDQALQGLSFPDLGKQERWLERESAHVAPGATDEAAFGRRVFTSGNGSTLTDMDGGTYVDLAAGALTQSLGHAHPETVEALSAQAQRLWNVHDSAFPERAELCELLARLLPSELDTYAFFSTGAEAVEAALRLVQRTAPPERNRIGALRHGFHGKTMGARMLVHWDVGTQSFAGNSVLGYAPHCYRCPLELEHPSCELRCASLVRRHIAEKPNVSALVFEPVQGAAGVITPPPGYWETVARACRDNGVLLVADEVLTGGGRTGSFLASEEVGVRPDLVVMAKGTANGFPFSVLAGPRELMHHPAASEPGAYASTYGGNPLGVAAATATLGVVEREALAARAKELGAVVGERLTRMRDRFPSVGDVRGLGLLHGVEFVRGHASREPAPETAREVYRAALDLGVRTALGGHVIRLSPPLNIDEGTLDSALDSLERALERVEGA